MSIPFVEVVQFLSTLPPELAVTAGIAAVACWRLPAIIWAFRRRS